MNILIGGDLVPTDVNVDLFEKGDIKNLIGVELLNILNKADIKIFNLEVPITNVISPIEKHGPNLSASIKSIKGIKALNPSLLLLANNHIMDQGKQGLYSTTRTLKENGISYIGAGKNIYDASKPYIIEKDNKIIGIYVCADAEFAGATETGEGANPFDPLESFDHIVELKNKVDYLIIVYHGGKEHYRYPSPYLQKICRKMVEKGGNLVICQHSHCVGAFENYKDSVIVYGQGNFLFNKLDNEYWNNALLLNIELKETVQINYIPIKKYNNGIRMANKEEGDKILNEFYERSNQIKDPNFIQTEYEKLAIKSLNNYLYSIGGYNRYSRKLSMILGDVALKYKFNKKTCLALQNFLLCDVHRELFLDGLQRRNNIEKV